MVTSGAGEAGRVAMPQKLIDEDDRVEDEEEDVDETEEEEEEGDVDPRVGAPASLPGAPPASKVYVYWHAGAKKHIRPWFSREQTIRARLYLKYYGLRAFLDTYLPDELISLHIYFLIKLLGFDIRSDDIKNAILTCTQPFESGQLSYQNLQDPLPRHYTVKILKYLQKAAAKVISTRLRLSHFTTVDDLIVHLRKAQRILVVTGAGISTSLGIPDFRSSQGFYSRLKHLGLEDPQDVFSLEKFTANPSLFYNIAHMVLPPANIYSPLHSFIKLLQDSGKLLRNYTQNIDNLEANVGIDPAKIIQCHGSFASASCFTCHFQTEGSQIFEEIRQNKIPLCPHCYKKREIIFGPYARNPPSDKQFNAPLSFGVMKPDITFFGEGLPSRFYNNIRQDVAQCDLLICIGTSLKVAPVSEIVNLVPPHIPQVLINRDPVNHADFDLSLLGLCDDIATYITKRMGWDLPNPNWGSLKRKNITFSKKNVGTYTFQELS